MRHFCFGWVIIQSTLIGLVAIVAIEDSSKGAAMFIV